MIERTEGMAPRAGRGRQRLGSGESCRGDRPLGAVLAELAAGWGQPPAAVIPPCLRLVRRLLENGFVDVDRGRSRRG